MPTRLIQTFRSNFSRLPLSTVLTVPFVLQTVGVVGLVGWLSWHNGRNSLERLATKLSNQTTARIQNHLESHLNIPYRLNQTFEATITSGAVDVEDDSALQTFFWYQAQRNQPGTTVAYSNQLGEVLGIHKTIDGQFLLLRQNELTNFHWNVYRLDETGQSAELLKSVPSSEQRYRPWHQAAAQQQQPTWSSIVQAQSVPGLIMTAAHLLFNVEGDLQGVLGFTVTLSPLTEFLRTLAISSSGQAFIIERSGKIVATSGQQWPLIAIEDETQRVSVLTSRNALMRNTANHLRQKFTSFDEINRKHALKFSVAGNQHYWVEVTPFMDARGIDWLVVVVIPEADFTTAIQANTLRTVVLCVLTLFLTFLLGTLTSQWIGRIVFRLKTAAKSIAQGQFEQTVAISPIMELDDLASSFNHMAQQLQRSFADWYSLNQALAESESRLRQFLEALPIGVVVHQRDGSVFYLNRAAKDLLSTDIIPPLPEQLPSICQVYRAGTNQLYPPEELPALRALRGESVTLENLEIRRDDRVISIRMRAIPILDGVEQITYAVATFEDVTLHKQAAKFLTDYSQTLESEVTERTDALRQSEAAKQAILNGIPDLLIYMKADGTYLNFLRGGAVQFGLDGHETERLNIYECTPRVLADQRMSYIQKAIATGERQIYEYDIEEGEEVRHEEARIVKTDEDEVLVIVRDITNRRRAEKAQEESLSLLTATLESTAEGILAVTQGGQVLAYNQKFLQMWDVPESLLAPNKMPVERLQALARQTLNPDAFQARMLELSEQTPEAVAFELIEMKDNRILERYTQPQRIGDRIVGRIWTFRDVTANRQAAVALEAANQELERLANLDGLTQVANRRYFDSYLFQEWQRLAREQQPLSLVLFDVDFFKQYNDCYGHQAGDNCLIQVSQAAMQTTKRPADLVARYGGEEFAIILPNTHQRGATAIAQRIQSAIQQLQIPHFQSVVGSFVTVSMGLTCRIPIPGSDFTRLVGEADQALYRAKEQGRNRYCIYHDG
ncbi:MAG: diguanylate cyclase [Cyanobacteria bacterium P01_F01_bin.86]